MPHSLFALYPYCRTNGTYSAGFGYYFWRKAFTCLFGSGEFALIGVGLIVMFIGALIYFLTLVLAFFGFVKGEAKSCPAQTTDLLVAIGKYKDLVNETVLSEEEFVELKKNLLSSTSKKATSIEDLKRWKKAVEQSLITEDEYQSIKSSILTK